MNPRQRRGILLLTLSALGLLGVFVLVAGYVSDVRAEVDPKVEVLELAKPAEKDKAITDDMVRTKELPRRWVSKTALRDRARLIGQVALADIPAGSVLQEGMLGSPPELATGEREIAILVDAETGVAGKISPGSIVDIVATFGGNDQEGVPAESNVVVPGRADHRRRPARAQGRQRRPGAEADPATVVPGHVRARSQGGADRDLRGVLRRRGPPRAAAAGRGVRAQEEAARVPPPDAEAEPVSQRLLIAIGDADIAGAASALASESDELEVVDRVSEPEELARVLRRLDVDVVALHDALGTVPVMDIAREIAASFPEVGMVLLSADPDPELMRAAMQTGIRDVVSLPLSLEQLESSARAAAQWSRALRERVSGEETAVGALAGNLIAVAGAKGGVGTTTVAIHLALAAARNAPGRPVCLVDFDLQKGDMRAYMDTPYRRSVVDLVEVADEISVRHLQETLFTHREGVRMLLAPDQGERAEEVDSNVARNVLGAVRARHALTVVDLGATVSEASAIGAEMASKVLVVSTPDVVALRGVRRLRDLWRRLQVREDDQDMLVLLNQASRKREVQPDLARKVVGGRLAETTIPADFAAFEAAVNTGSPARLEDQKLRGAFEALATELEALPAVDEPADADGEPRGLLARLSGERGQTTVEFAGILPLLLVVVLLLWQIGLVGLHVRARRPLRPRGRARAGDRHDRHQAGPPVRGQGDGGPAEGVAEGRQGRPSRGQHRARAR